MAKDLHLTKKEIRGKKAVLKITLKTFSSDGIPKEYLLQVKGSSHLNCKAIHETLSASSLNTNDCFVLVSGGMSYVWFGKVCV